MKRGMTTGVLALILWLGGTAGAGVMTNNQFFYKPGLGARGTQEMAQFEAGLERVDAHLGKYKTLGDPGYETLATALATIGSAPVSLMIPAGTVPITTNTTIPANVHLVVQRGGIFQVASGVTLTIQGPLQAGPYQIFSGAGTATLGAGSPSAHQIYPAWWYSGSGPWNAALTAAMTAAKNAGGGKLVLTQDITLSSTYVHDYHYATLEGNGHRIDASAITSGTAIRISSSNSNAGAMYYQAQRYVGNFDLKGNGKTGGVTGILLQGENANASASHLTLKNINISNFGTGLKEFSYAYEVDCYKVEIHSCTTGVEVLSGGTDYGARMAFFGGIVYGCSTAVKNHYGSMTIHAFGTAFDYCPKLADLHGGKLVLVDCHVEAIGAEAGGALEAIKVDGYGAYFHMIGGWYLGGGYSGNTQYLVNVVLPTNQAVFRDVQFYDVQPGSGFLATGNGTLTFEPLSSLASTETCGLKYSDYTKGNLADGSFELAAGGTLRDDWYVTDGGSIISRYNRTNLEISSSNDYARTGTYSLKANKKAAGAAKFELAVPLPRKGALAAWQFYYRKPGNGTGTMTVYGYWAQQIGFSSNFPVWGRIQEVAGQNITFTSAAVPWTVNSTYTHLRPDQRAPEWATHFVLRFNLDNLTAGQSYYFDDLIISLN